jgi:hypothetical protein
MAIEQTPFRRYHEEKQQDTFTIKLSKDGKERALLEKCKRIIEQKKDSTTLKTLAWLGAKVLLEEKTAYIINTLFKNKRNNARSNIIDFEE